MKKAVVFFLTLVSLFGSIFIINSCGSQVEVEQQQYLILTDEMEQEIKKEIEGTGPYSVSFAKVGIIARAKGIKDDSYETCEITNYKKNDEYSYVAYGYVYKRNKTSSLQFTHTIRAIADSESENGYKLVSETVFN